MIYKKGNLLDILSPNNAIMHGCNMQGVWGSGVAKQMREKYPDAFVKYKDDLAFGNPYKFVLGDISVFKYADGCTILSAFTQENYGRDGTRYVSYDALDEVFHNALKWSRDTTKTVNIPDLIGAGLGGGDYDTIVSIIKSNECKWNAEIVCWQFNKP